MKNPTKGFQFQPFSAKQKKLLTWWMDPSPYKDYDMIICDGSIRSGKTVAMIDGFITWSLATYKYQDFILAGKSMGALKRNVLKPMMQILLAKGIQFTYNRSENYFEIGSNTYYCFGANNEAAQDVLQGLTAAGALADDAALLPENFIVQMIARCSSVEDSKIWMNCNPESPYHYLKMEYIDKNHEKRILHLHFTLDDNLTLTPKAKERYMRQFTGLWFKRMILGLWVLAEGVIYDMWDDLKHTMHCPSAGYQEFGVAIDYATASVMTFGLYGIQYDPKGDRVYLLKEYYYDAKIKGRQKTDSEFADDFTTFLGEITPKNIYLDPSAASFKAELRKRGYNQVRDADNDVINGIRMVATFLSAMRFFVDKNCIATIKEYASYIWDAKAQTKGEDKPVKINDHAMDRNRYFIYTRFAHIQEVYAQVETTTYDDIMDSSYGDIF
jgi:PBSX family phage terminase large subunit